MEKFAERGDWEVGVAGMRTEEGVRVWKKVFCWWLFGRGDEVTRRR